MGLLVIVDEAGLSGVVTAEEHAARGFLLGD